jgi:hypothetical protein
MLSSSLSVKDTHQVSNVYYFQRSYVLLKATLAATGLYQLCFVDSETVCDCCFCMCSMKPQSPQILTDK